jgi:hypothetical protein
VTTAQREADEPERGLAQAAHPRAPGATPDLLAPLSDEELDALDGFLLDQDTEEGMTLDMLDGFLHPGLGAGDGAAQPLAAQGMGAR